MFGNLFKPRTHYVFDYKPRYYNERKERLNKLEGKYHKNNVENEEDIAIISLSKSNLRGEWKRSKKVVSDRGTTLRIAIIITILVGMVAYIFEIHKLI
ncbi:MAG: hypothetical protein KGV44_11485 [Flavobacteriaceae bacterium]|nr:hypothetical protein [Flavobacteriaceae bacterium]